MIYNLCSRATATLAAAIVAMSATAAPGGITVKAEVDSTAIVMGNLNHLRVTVDMPVSATAAQLVDFPVLPAGTEYIDYKGIDVVGSDSTMTVTNNRRNIKFDFTIQAFDPGTVTVPPFAVLAAPGADTTFSNVVTFKVLPVDVDSLETINPAASIVAAQSKWYDYIPDWLIWTLAAILLIAAGIWAFFTFRKRKEEAAIIAAKPVPPYDLAVSRLTELKSRNLPEQGHEKEFYTELVDILRQYLQGRFGINAMEMTSTQIVKALRANPDTRMTADEMRSVLSMADFVKFAKVRPLPDDNIKSFSRARTFVEETKPKPEPEADGQEADQASESPKTTKTNK